MSSADRPPPDQDVPDGPAGVDARAPVDEPWPDGPPASPGLIRLDLWGTVVFTVLSVGRRRRRHAGHRLSGRHLRRRAGGRRVHRLRVGLATAVGRSRYDEIDLAGLFFLSRSAPPAARRPLLGLLAVQIVVGVGAAAIRPFTVLAFCVLAPLWGLGLLTLWSARNGRFPPRGQRRPDLPGRGDEDAARWTRPTDRDRRPRRCAPGDRSARMAAPVRVTGRGTAEEEIVRRMSDHATEKTTIAADAAAIRAVLLDFDAVSGVGARPEGGRGPRHRRATGRAKAVRFRAAAMGRSTSLHARATTTRATRSSRGRSSRATSCARSTASYTLTPRRPVDRRRLRAGGRPQACRCPGSSSAAARAGSCTPPCAT